MMVHGSATTQLALVPECTENVLRFSARLDEGAPEEVRFERLSFFFNTSILALVINLFTG